MNKKIKELEASLKEAEKSSDHYEARCGELQREVNRLTNVLNEISVIHACEVIWASYAKSCTHCKKLAEKIRP